MHWSASTRLNLIRSYFAGYTMSHRTWSFAAHRRHNIGVCLIPYSSKVLWTNLPLFFYQKNDKKFYIHVLSYSLSYNVGKKIRAIFLRQFVEPVTRSAADFGCNWGGILIFDYMLKNHITLQMKIFISEPRLSFLQVCICKKMFDATKENVLMIKKCRKNLNLIFLLKYTFLAGFVCNSTRSTVSISVNIYLCHQGIFYARRLSFYFGSHFVFRDTPGHMRLLN